MALQRFHLRLQYFSHSLLNRGPLVHFKTVLHTKMYADNRPYHVSSTLWSQVRNDLAL